MINKELSDMIKDIALKKDPFVLSVFVYQKMKDAYFALYGRRRRF